VEATVVSCHYDVWPRVVRAGGEGTVSLRARSPHGRFDDAAEYEATIVPMEGIGGRTVRAGLRPVAGCLRIPHTFAAEQEYALAVARCDGEARVPAGEFRVYAVGPDLFARRPFKGDLHLHSSESDGRESPAWVAAACRRIGLDFMAVTDHWKYAPSLDAIAAFAGTPIDLRIFPGEEVHQEPDNPVHIVNFGGAHGICPLIRAGEPYLSEVRAIAEGLGADGLPPELRFAYAQCLWTYRSIRAAGGVAIFAHPYWIWRAQYNVPEALIARHFADQPFDAFELLGGFHRYETESNLLQLARYHDECGRGRRIPVVGSSDSHGCERGELFGWYWTVVFAPTAEFADLAAAIRGAHAVAVEALPGETRRAHGPFRLVKYAHFLLREVLPLHDALCVEEGRLMLDHVAGDPAAAAALGRLQGRTRRLMDSLWQA